MQWDELVDCGRVVCTCRRRLTLRSFTFLRFRSVAVRDVQRHILRHLRRGAMGSWPGLLCLCILRGGVVRTSKDWVHPPVHLSFLIRRVPRWPLPFNLAFSRVTDVTLLVHVQVCCLPPTPVSIARHEPMDRTEDGEKVRERNGRVEEEGIGQHGGSDC